MKCPNCGAEMKEGRLYCENCGEDIHIVPDFEPELELNIEQSIGNIVLDVSQGEKEESSGEVKAASAGAQSGRQNLRIRAIAAGWIGISIVVIALIIGGISIYQYFSIDFQTERAKQAAASEQYEKAIRYYTRAIELDKFNVKLKLDLAEVYFLQNDKEKYEYWLKEIVADPNTDAEQLESAYGKLIAVYRAREDYQTINDMLLNYANDKIRSAYQSYLAEEPQFGIPAGSYTEMQALKLTVTGKGIIYYTLNGGIPDENAERYTAPILLENGDYLVRAIFVNENGVYSEVATAEYQINVEELEIPELNVDGGEYNVPVLITVLNDDGEVYYTVDGTNPTMASTQYTAPIPMPLGLSTFKFARLQTGRSSAVVERTFTLELVTGLSPEQAVDTVRGKALDSGKIIDDAGHFDDTAACYQYQYLYVVRIEGAGDYYVVAEMLADQQGIATRTGNYYAVNVHTNSCFRLQIGEGGYKLLESL